MAYRTLIFGTDDIYPQLKPFYDAEIQHGNLEIIAYGVFENEVVRFTVDENKRIEGLPDDNFGINLAIISSHKKFFQRMKYLESKGVKRNRIIDGRVFQTNGFDFPRLLNEGIAYGVLNKNFFVDTSHSIYQRIFSDGMTIVKLGAKSYSAGTRISGSGAISIGNFCSIAAENFFYMAQTLDHNYRSVGTYALERADWEVPENFYLPKGVCEIRIGSDVWIGSDCVFKCSNPKKPLIIGDGAVIASDSVVVKNVPPYAIVGGNPAKIIKFRFSEDVIESLLRIKWWDWSLDKIHDNFKYFNDIDKFISLHDRS